MTGMAVRGLCLVPSSKALVDSVPLRVSDSQSEVSCTVLVRNQLDTVNISSGFTYKTELTPVITDVSPRRGGTAGGTTLTIQGSGFRCSRRARHTPRLDSSSLRISDSLPEHNCAFVTFLLHPEDGKIRTLHT